jgi:hypothetical protein
MTSCNFLLIICHHLHLFQNARCHMLASSDTTSSVLKMCNMCSMRNRGYNPACFWQNKNCCVICGSLIQTQKKIVAKVCIRHSFQNTRKCVLCSFMVSSTSTEAQLCMNCGFGHGERICACFDIWNAVDSVFLKMIAKQFKQGLALMGNLYVLSCTHRYSSMFISYTLNTVCWMQVCQGGCVIP